MGCVRTHFKMKIRMLNHLFEECSKISIQYSRSGDGEGSSLGKGDIDIEKISLKLRTKQW